MSKFSLSEQLLIEVAHLLHPLKSLNTSDQVLSFLERLGYKVPTSDLVNTFFQVSDKTGIVIEDAIELVKANTDERKLQALVPLLLSIKEALDELLELETAIQSAPGLAADFVNNAPLDQLSKRLLDFLLFQNFYKRQPKIFGALYLMGVLDDEILVKDDAIFQPDCRLKVVRWERLPRYLSEPGSVIDELYTWNTDFNSDQFLRRIELFLRATAVAGGIYRQSDNVKEALENHTDDLLEVRIPIFSKGVYPDAYSQFGLNITPAEAITGKKKGMAFIPYLFGATEFDFELSEEWEAIFQSSINIDAGLGLVLRPPFSLDLLQNIFTSPENAASVDSALIIQQKKNASNQTAEFFLFGDEANTHLSVSEISIKFFAIKNSSRQDAGAELEIKKVNLLITTGDGDSFLSKVLPQTGINTDFGLGVGFSLSNGIYFKGSAGIEILLPIHIQLGPIEIQAITIAIRPQDGDIPVEVSCNIKAELGPLLVVVENIGLSSKFSFPSNGTGKLGPIDFNLGFKPPNGLGLSVNAGAVIGGGYLFFDFEKEEYAGVLELTIAGFISVKAIGLITTKMPDGNPGFSMLLIITAEFFPPFQLGYGFTLMAVGGLLGLNRTVLLDPLRNGVRTGAVNSIMFPQNVIANAPRIISDLKAIFPPYEGKFLIGPMAKIGWGTPTLISLSMGLIIEIPGNIVILGVLAVLLPDKDVPIVKIQVAFSGTIDFDKQMLTFDASLFESSILTMTLEGEMAVRLKWGDSPDFVLTVGGFHPSYTPPPLALPTMRRLAINILNTDIAKIRVECYQAITPNSVQFGAGADIRFDLEACSIKGHVGFDALFQFSPFYFIITLSANFDLSALNIDVMTVRVRMSLEGPTPWRAKGTGSVSLLFGEISADFDQTWGEQKNTNLPDIAIFPKLIAELKKKEQWSTVLTSGKNILVSIRKFEEASQNLLILHPAGSLVVQQKLVPLSVDIEKVGNQKTSDVKRMEIASASCDGFDLTVKPVDENFARAQYQNLSDAQKLSKPPFEKMPGGVEVSFGENVFKNGKMVRKKVEYELTVIDKEPAKPLPFIETGLLFANFLKGDRASKSALSKSHAEKLKPFDQKLNVLEEGYTVAFQANNKAYGTKATFASEAMAQSYMRDLMRQKPSLKQQIHIVPSYELQEA